MIRTLAWLFPFWLISASVFGQTHIPGTGHTPVPLMSLHRPNVLKVPANTTVTLASGEWDVIEIAGTAKVSRTADTTIKVTDLQILEGGTLDVGTQTDPVLRRVEFIFRDTPLLTGTDGNLGPDPEQFGNGINCFGQLVTYGRRVDTPFNTFTPTAAGATQITLTVPTNWQVGDELLFHDTSFQYKLSQIGLSDRPLRDESKVTIKAISGQTVTLSKPLDFEHSASFGLLPYVANATRNIVFRSENPNGTRGHTMFMDKAHVDLYYTSFLDLGRTRPEKLDNFRSNDLHVGTNQIARYGGPHWHHVHGHSDEGGYTGRMVGCFGHGSDITKWFLVQHGTHDLLVTDNVATKFVGACYTTEDGFEVRGKYLRNLGMYCRGNGSDAKFNLLEPNPGAEGSPFWFHGSQHTLEHNVALCSAIGYVAVHRNQVSGRLVPSVPGGTNDTPLDSPATKFISTVNNVAWSCGIGLEIWNTPADWTFSGLTALNSNRMGVFCGNGEQSNLTLKSSKLLNDYAGVPADFVKYLPDTGVHSSAGYTLKVALDGVEIEGFNDGTMDAFEGYSIKNGRYKTRGWGVNYSSFQAPNYPLHIENVKFESPLAIVIGHDPAVNHPPGSTSRIINWQGTGKNYWLYQVGAPMPAGAIPLAGVGNALASETEVTPPDPPPAENHPPVVSAIAINPPPPVYELSTVTYAASANDADMDALTWVATYQYGTGTPITYKTGMGSSAPWDFSYPAGARTYNWAIEFSDTKSSTKSTLVVNVLANPPVPPPTTELEKRVATLEATVKQQQEQIIALQTSIKQLQEQIIALDKRVQVLEAKLKNKN